MTKMNEDVKKVISNMKIFPVSTSTKEGIPNVIPIAFVKVYDEDTLLIADNYLDKTYKNIEENPYVSIYVCDTAEGKAYQIKGEAIINTSGKVYEDTVKWVKEVSSKLNPKSGVVVKITKIYNCQPGPKLGEEL
ncbi:pyridoxamine 5'-phosphate oxidase family protein [Sedimentibacter sp. zth1]|uniref:pyridoxamine 5'-phosphate oxidase family protein n=1 Tax=Sedimentibacter sp. zth1 TaxID=2816908 RepID=UPI001A9104CD|nr:pyridoxamine 5'-phosphate oxidase family protein [Sedimentibacter sp. zth1]QSX06252.1 pyridoxamine 5'-phosphate oxidase family protein [Sedimentibacter sp. zth1]